MDYVIANPPLDTIAPASAKAQAPRKLTIVQRISHKPKEDGGGPFVVSCYLDTDQSTQYVAKIFDGFEYELAEWGEDGRDCMYLADMHYSCEAAAYESIPARFQGSVVPRYFGSWTFCVPIGLTGRHRWVRMILIEYIHGECMLDMVLHARGATPNNPRPEIWRREGTPPLDYRLLPPEKERLEVLARVVEADMMIWWYGGVQHGDVAPRNIMISRAGPSNAVTRVALIDFNHAYVLHRCDRGRERAADLGLEKGLPISPIEHYWTSGKFAYGNDYSHWIPESWAVADEEYAVTHLLSRKWLINRWRASPKFQPPSEDFLNWQCHEMMGEPYQQLVKELRSFLAERGQPTGKGGGSSASQTRVGNQ